MRGKQTLALLLAALMLLLCVPVSAASSAFTDIADPTTAQTVEVLQTMGVVSGVSYNRFDPDASLTRAQFTKMAVTVLGKAEQVGSFQSFTIFPDVKSTHWAAGYINLAVRGDGKFISGFADGRFGPEKKINYGEAVTILMRLLGYKDSDVGLVWPSGFITAANAAGLTEGLSLQGSDLLTRAQAAQLFVNLLRTNKKAAEGGTTTTTFGESVAASVEKDVILLDAKAKADDGSPAVETTTGIHKLANGHAPSLLQGRRGMLLLNSKQEAWTFIPSEVGDAKDITVSKAKAGSLTDQTGKEYTISATVPAYYKGEKKTYGDVFINLRAGTRVTLHFGITGKVESIFVGETSNDGALVMDKDGAGSRLTAITGGRKDYKILRNGESVSAAALRAYDVATYLAAENTVQISTLRLTGRYDNAYPNTEAPTKISVLGTELEVLPSALATLSSFKIGDQITLLLTEDAQVAGAVDAKTLRSDCVGVAKVSGDAVTVSMVEGLTLKGKVESHPNSYDGQLVTASSWNAGYLSLTILDKKAGTGDLDLAKRTLNGKALAENVKLFERSTGGPVAQISLEDIRLTTVPSYKIQYVRYNDNGKISLLIMDTVSGNQYLYGISHVIRNDSFTVTLRTPKGDLGPYITNRNYPDEWARIIVNEGEKLLKDYDPLKKITGVSNKAWESEDVVFFNNKSYDVSEDVVCYNRATAGWVTLGVARAFGENMTLYVDEFDVVRGVEVG